MLSVTSAGILFHHAIQIPQILMDFAQLKDSVAFIGSSNFGQIMDGARWKAEFEAFNETGDSFLDVLD